MSVLPCQFSESAKEEILKILATKNISSEYGLRIGIKGGGCSGISYLFGFDKQQTTDDVFTWEGLSVFIEKKHLMYVAGLNIGFEDGVHAKGFIFENPETKFN